MTARAAMVRKNLQHLQEASAAKRNAQNMYYGQGRSPFVRNKAGNPKLNEQGTSVQQRIGNNRNSQQYRLKKYQFQKPMNFQQKPMNTKQQKFQRINQFQNKKVFKNNNNDVKVLRTMDGKVKILRKINPANKNRKPQANNFVVKVPNPIQTQKFQIKINKKIQDEIKLIQATKNEKQIVQVSERAFGMSDYNVPIASTSVSINDRFNTYKYIA